MLRCATRVAFRPEASGRLVQELKHVRGGGAALKLLLDIADYALRTNQDDYAEDALEAISATIADSFNYSNRHIMFDVMAYRLPYVDERLVAWLLTQVSMTWIAFLKPRAMARLVDDCVIERPELGPVVANQAAYLPCHTLSDYREHVAFVQTLFTPLGRALGLEGYIYVPRAGAKNLEPATVEFFLSFFQTLRDVPESEVAATRILRWWVDDIATHAPDLLPDTIASLREGIPEHPPWPPPPRSTTYGDEILQIARAFEETVVQRSYAMDDGPGPDHWNAYVRRNAVQEHVSAAEAEQRGRIIEERWGAYRRGGR